MTLKAAKDIFAKAMKIARQRPLTATEKKLLARSQAVIRSHTRTTSANPKRKPAKGISPAHFRKSIEISGGKYFIYDHAFNEVKAGPFDNLKDAKAAFAIIKSRERYTTSPRHHAELGFKTTYKGGQKKHNAPKGTLIYGRCLRIEAIKTTSHTYGGKPTAAGQKYYHDFTSKNAKIYGLPNGDLLISTR